MKLKDTQNTMVLGIFLGIISVVAAALLAWVADYTREPIAQVEKNNTNRALRAVLPEFDNDPGKCTIVFKSDDSEKYDVTFFVAKMGDRIVGVAGKSITKSGYNGLIQSIVGLNLDGSVRTVIITKQSETPGLGADICERKRQKTIKNIFEKCDENALAPNSILDQFAGHKTTKGDSWKSPWKVRKDGGQVEYVTGATITSRAVTNVVYRIGSTYAVNGQAIMQKFGEKAK